MHNKIKDLAMVMKLPNLKENYNILLEEATIKKLSYYDFLEMILEQEYEVRFNNSISKKIFRAKFPYKRFFHDLDLDIFERSICSKIKDLENLNFIDSGRNVVLIGNPGVGKTHIAISLGILACQKRKNVLYISIPNLIKELKEAMTLNQLTAYKRRFINYDLFILDELGYISFDKTGSEL